MSGFQKRPPGERACCIELGALRMGTFSLRSVFKDFHRRYLDTGHRAQRKVGIQMNVHTEYSMVLLSSNQNKPK